MASIVTFNEKNWSLGNFLPIVPEKTSLGLQRAKPRGKVVYCNCCKLQGCWVTMGRRKMPCILERMAPFLFMGKKEKDTQQNSKRQWVFNSLLLSGKPLWRPESSGPQPERDCSFPSSWAMHLESHCFWEKKNTEPGEGTAWRTPVRESSGEEHLHSGSEVGVQYQRRRWVPLLSYDLKVREMTFL